MMRVIRSVFACSVSFDCTSQGRYQSCTSRLSEPSLLADATGRRGQGKDAPKLPSYFLLDETFRCAQERTPRSRAASQRLSFHRIHLVGTLVLLYGSTNLSGASQSQLAAQPGRKDISSPPSQTTYLHVHGDMAPATSRPFLGLLFHLADSVQSPDPHNHQTLTITRPLQSLDPHNHILAITGCSRSNTSHRVLEFLRFWSPVVC